jgi:hypothetical protein
LIAEFAMLALRPFVSSTLLFLVVLGLALVMMGVALYIAIIVIRIRLRISDGTQQA